MQGVEGVEELLPRLVLAGEKLDVVDENHVRLAEAFLEADRASFPHRLDEFARELLDGRVANMQTGAVALYVVSDGVQQVGLAEPGPAVDEERVVGLAGELGHGEGGSVAEAVSATDHELLEGVLRVEAALLHRSAVGRALEHRGLGGPVRGHHPHGRALIEAPRRGAVQQREVALLDPGPDVLGGPDEKRAALQSGELQGVEPDVELEVRRLSPELFANVIPDLGELLAHGQTRPSSRATCTGNMAVEGLRGPRPTALGAAESTPVNRSRTGVPAAPGGGNRKSRQKRFGLRRPPREAHAEARNPSLYSASPRASARPQASHRIDEAHLPAQEAKARADTWVSRSHAHARGATRAEAPPQQGPHAAHALTMSAGRGPA